jgi:hypothetical protein
LLFLSISLFLLFFLSVFLVSFSIIFLDGLPVSWPLWRRGKNVLISQSRSCVHFRARSRMFFPIAISSQRKISARSKTAIKVLKLRILKSPA